MGHAFSKIFIHTILVVKNRKPLIQPEMENDLYNYISAQVEKCDSKVLSINGAKDHVHALISLSPKLSFSDLVKQIKGSSSHWINSQDLIRDKFAWQSGPRGFSVSYSNIGQVIRYIDNQKEYHKKMNFTDEYKAFLSAHKIENR